MSYDKSNIFAKIIRGEIPCNKVYEDEYVLSFYDINPRAKVHILVIPKGEFEDVGDFGARASTTEQAAIFAAISKIAKSEGIDKSGYRLVANTGKDGGQEVPHFHFHLLGGGFVGTMPPILKK